MVIVIAQTGESKSDFSKVGRLMQRQFAVSQFCGWGLGMKVL